MIIYSKRESSVGPTAHEVQVYRVETQPSLTEGSQNGDVVLYATLSPHESLTVTFSAEAALGLYRRLSGLDLVVEAERKAQP